MTNPQLNKHLDYHTIVRKIQQQQQQKSKHHKLTKRIVNDIQTVHTDIPGELIDKIILCCSQVPSHSQKKKEKKICCE